MSSSIRLHENQEFIDFTDENKASSMGERYLQLYDNEWNDAFTELSRGHNMAEREVIQTLLDILTVSTHLEEDKARSHTPVFNCWDFL